MTQKHTPLPWFLGGPVERDAPAVRKYPSMPSEYWEIGESEVDFPPALACVWHEEDAHFILAAVHAHEGLLAVAEAFERATLHFPNCRTWHGSVLQCNCQIRELKEAARIAIAKAKEVR